MSNINDELEKKVGSLKKAIDDLDTCFKLVGVYVLEVAIAMDESGKYERKKICRQIKKLLEDKIMAGKVTAKWIEESLPKEYKRDYDKSGVTSLSADKGATVQLMSSRNIEPKHPNPKDSGVSKVTIGELDFEHRKSQMIEFEFTLPGEQVR